MFLPPLFLINEITSILAILNAYIQFLPLLFTNLNPYLLLLHLNSFHHRIILPIFLMHHCLTYHYLMHLFPMHRYLFQTFLIPPISPTLPITLIHKFHTLTHPYLLLKTFHYLRVNMTGDPGIRRYAPSY